MHETSLSLLERLRQSPENEGWNRLADLYTPLIRAWLRRYDVQDSDANDLVQEVLLAVSKDLGKFEHRGQPGAFRGWLKAILINRLRKFWRARDHRPQARGDSDIDARLAQMDDPASDMSQVWDREHDQYVLRQLMALAEPQFEPKTWKAFRRVALEGAKPDVVAQEMGISRNAVVIAKCRVLSRLRQESKGLIESSSVFFAKSCNPWRRSGLGNQRRFRHQTADHGVVTAASPCQDIPIQLTEHARYEVLGLIGKGGMGDVYKARHRKMERTVALKVINRGLVRKAEAIDRFHREVKAAAQLSHPNIVTSHDADQAGDYHFMVMEFVDGVDLSQPGG